DRRKSAGAGRGCAAASPPNGKAPRDDGACHGPLAHIFPFGPIPSPDRAGAGVVTGSRWRHAAGWPVAGRRRPGRRRCDRQRHAAAVRQGRGGKPARRAAGHRHGRDGQRPHRPRPRDAGVPQHQRPSDGSDLP
ncbi:hypothetical protein OY671_012330, partial [Metschnikowia pulcherrima]